MVSPLARRRVFLAENRSLEFAGKVLPEGDLTTVRRGDKWFHRTAEIVNVKPVHGAKGRARKMRIVRKALIPVRLLSAEERADCERAYANLQSYETMTKLWLEML